MGSLLDEKTSSIGAPKSNKGKGGNNQTIKLVAALVLFGAAGLVFAWSQGYLTGSGAEVVQPTQEQIELQQQQQKQAEEIRKSGKAVEGGA